MELLKHDPKEGEAQNKIPVNQDLVNKLAHSNEKLRQFTYIASHDLQEPLSIVSGYLSLLAAEHDLSAEGKEYVTITLDAVKRMRQLILALLEYSRNEQAPLNISQTACTPVVEAVIKELAPLVQAAHGVLAIEPLPSVRADKVLLGELLRNLLSNALKFRGDQAPIIKVSATESGSEWVFAVKDNGIGIERRFQDRVFEAFHRLNRQDQYPGTGLGLTICKEIVERHGGRIWFDSTPGKGTTFYFTIPKPLGDS